MVVNMQIGDKTIGEGCKPLMIAEEGQANQGDFQVAADICRIASAAGADGIEFQFFLADDMYVNSHEGYGIYKDRELSLDEIKGLINIAHENNLICQVAGLSPQIIQYCAEAGADIFVVNASDLTNPVIIDAVAQTGKPFWLATLMGNMEEIDWAVNYATSKCNSDIGILHGQHVMSSEKIKGVPSELLQLDCIASLKERYGLVTGFVDHTDTTFVPALAVSNGADFLTKHLAPNKSWRGPDWMVCLDPEDWRESKEMFNYAISSRGASKEISQAEFKDRSLHRRSIFTNRELQIGHIIVEDDLTMLRPGDGGLDPRQINELLGKTVKNVLKKHHQLQMSDVN